MKCYPFDNGAIHCEEPETHFEKMCGLLGRDTLPPGRIMLLRRCRLIHTFGMRFALDIVFIDRSGAPVKTVRNLRPNRIAFGGFRARHTIETSAGNADLLPSSFKCFL